VGISLTYYLIDMAESWFPQAKVPFQALVVELVGRLVLPQGSKVGDIDMKMRGGGAGEEED